MRSMIWTFVLAFVFVAALLIWGSLLEQPDPRCLPWELAEGHSIGYCTPSR